MRSLRKVLPAWRAGSWRLFQACTCLVISVPDTFICRLHIIIQYWRWLPAGYAIFLFLVHRLKCRIHNSAHSREEETAADCMNSDQ